MSGRGEKSRTFFQEEPEVALQWSGIRLRGRLRALKYFTLLAHDLFWAIVSTDPVNKYRFITKYAKHLGEVKGHMFYPYKDLRDEKVISQDDAIFIQDRLLAEIGLKIYWDLKNRGEI